MHRSRRGLQDIRTMAGRSTSPGAKHKAYVRLAVLEMERTRRQHEYETAQARADMALDRVRKLESEIAETIAAIAPSTGVSRTPAPASGNVNPDLVAVKHAYGAKPPAKRVTKRTIKRTAGA